MQKIKDNQKKKIYKEFDEKISILLYKWKTSDTFNRDIESFAESVRNSLKNVLKDN